MFASLLHDTIMSIHEDDSELLLKNKVITTETNDIVELNVTREEFLNKLSISR